MKWIPQEGTPAYRVCYVLFGGIVLAAFLAELIVVAYAFGGR